MGHGPLHGISQATFPNKPVMTGRQGRARQGRTGKRRGVRRGGGDNGKGREGKLERQPYRIHGTGHSYVPAVGTPAQLS